MSKKTKRKKAGRHTLCNKTRLGIAERLIGFYGFEYASLARALGIDRSTFRNWMRKNKGFKRAVEKGKASQPQKQIARMVRLSKKELDTLRNI